MTTDNSPRTIPPGRKRREISTFLILTAVVMPLLTVGVVGGFGLAVWCWQLYAGPPSASHKG